MAEPSTVQFNFPKEFRDLSRRCEVWCVAGCCGLDAFSFDDDTLDAAIEHFGVSETEQACVLAMEFAESMRTRESRLYSGQNEFNNCWQNGEALHKWVKQLVGSIRKRIGSRLRQDS